MKMPAKKNAKPRARFDKVSREEIGQRKADSSSAQSAADNLHPRRYASHILARISRALICLVAFALVFSLTSATVYSQEPEDSTEYKVKVAYLYNFARYVKWPQTVFVDKDAPFVIGILGEAPFGSMLDRLSQSRKIDDRRIVIKRFAAPADYTPCQILFVTQTVNAEQREEIVKRTKESPVLIVGETEGFALYGAGINF